jgi:hypothetical protein
MMDFQIFSIFQTKHLKNVRHRPLQALAAAVIHNSAQIALKCSRIHHFPTKNNLPVSLEKTND